MAVTTRTPAETLVTILQIKKGAQLLASFKDPRDTFLWIVLAQVPRSGRVEYVTWWYNDQDGGFSNGHYFTDSDGHARAAADFIERCKRCL